MLMDWYQSGNKVVSRKKAERSMQKVGEETDTRSTVFLQESKQFGHVIKDFVRLS